MNFDDTLEPLLSDHTGSNVSDNRKSIKYNRQSEFIKRKSKIIESHIIEVLLYQT